MVLYIFGYRPFTLQIEMKHVTSKGLLTVTFSTNHHPLPISQPTFDPGSLRHLTLFCLVYTFPRAKDFIYNPAILIAVLEKYMSPLLVPIPILEIMALIHWWSLLLDPHRAQEVRERLPQIPFATRNAMELIHRWSWLLHPHYARGAGEQLAHVLSSTPDVMELTRRWPEVPHPHRTRGVRE